MKTFRYFWSHVKNYKGSLFLIIFGISAATISLNILAPYFVSLFIDTLVSYAKDGDPIHKTDAFQILIFLIGTEIVNNVGFRTAGYINARFQPIVMRDIEQDCFHKYHRHSMQFFGKEFIGSLVSKANRLVNGFERIADLLYWDFLPTILTLVIFLVILFLKFPTVALLFLVWSIVFLATSIGYSLWKLKYDKEIAALDSQVTASFADSLSNYSQVKTFAHQKHEDKLFGEISEHRFQRRHFNWHISEHLYNFQGIFMGILLISSLYVSAQLFFKGLMTIGELSFIQFIFFDLLKRLWELGRQTKDFAESMADCNEMIILLDKTPDILDKKKAQKCRISKGLIEIKNISFGYSSDKPLFKDLSISLKSGEKIGLVGKSGGGKSTLTKLLLRFEELQEGQILIDGQDITDLKQNDLRSHISFVPQDTSLFHRTLKENIGYGNLKASDKEIIEAAKKAQAHDFIQKTSDGYESKVGERGIKLSGGERQRIAIARAMLKKAPILILDEATSALDSQSEQLIQTALHEIMKGKTTLAIAHRLSTLREMDRIIVLDEGHIVEEGPHAELLKKKGAYAELWNHQVGGFIVE